MFQLTAILNSYIETVFFFFLVTLASPQPRWEHKQRDVQRLPKRSWSDLVGLWRGGRHSVHAVDPHGRDDWPSQSGESSAQPQWGFSRYWNWIACSCLNTMTSSDVGFSSSDGAARASLPARPWRALWFGPIIKAVFVAFTLSLPQSNLDCLVRSYIVIMQLSVFLCSVLKPGFVFPFVVFRSWLCLPFPLCTPVLPQPLSPEPACLTSPAGAHRVSTGLPPGWHHTSVCLAHAPPLGYCPPAHTYMKHIIHLPRLLYVSSFT